VTKGFASWVTSTNLHSVYGLRNRRLDRIFHRKSDAVLSKARKAIHRKIVLYTPYFMSLPTIIARSDLAAPVPHVIGIYCSKALANIKMMSLPVADVPQIVLRQH
jgi:hypothetical protein